MGVKRQTKRIVRELKAAGIPELAGRVKKGLLRMYRKTPRHERENFNAIAAVQSASTRAFQNFWHGLSEVEKVKFKEKAGVL